MKGKNICAVGLGGQSVFLTVDHFHLPGETVHAERIYTECGGKAYNQAVAAARLGAKTIFIGAVGNDNDGQACREHLISENITPRLMVSDKSATAYACILTDAEGENRVTVYRGAAEELSAEFINGESDSFRDCAAILVGFECPLEATLEAMEQAKRAGAVIILNPAPAVPVDISVLRLADIITPNAREAQTLLGAESEEPAELCRALDEAGIKCAVVTLGGDGALLFTDGAGYKYPPIPCRAVDTTGAGDCFSGALAAALAEGRGIFEAVNDAVVASSLSVRRPHVMTALPTAEELENSYVRLTPVRIH